jgi:hypothetical protein
MSQPDKDYYKTLGVDRVATDEAIKKSFRELALEYHPDRKPTAENETRFKEITRAYNVIGDPQRRAEYDDKERSETEAVEAAEARKREAEKKREQRARERSEDQAQKLGYEFRGGSSESSGPKPPLGPKPSPEELSGTKTQLPPSLIMRLWWLPAFIPFIGPSVSWSYATIKTGGAKYKRWALLYCVLMVCYMISLVNEVISPANSSTKGNELTGGIILLWWIVGPMIQARRRRKEVLLAISLPAAGSQA